MTKIQKGKCFECGEKWYWCQECGAAGCARDGCSQQKQIHKKEGFLSSESIKCRVCKS